MVRKANGVSRRNILKLTGGSIAAAGATGLASAEPTDKVEVNVGFKSARGRAMTRSSADEVVREFNSIEAMTIRVPKRAATALEKNPHIRYVEENGTMEALAQTTPWGVDRVDADVAHDNGDTGSGADIAIVDTGIDDDHPDLQANVGSGKSFVTCGSGGYTGSCILYGNSNSCNDSWSDDNNHGTHCAGIANAVDNSQGVVGVSTQATLHAVKVLDCSGSGSFSDIAAGVEYVADQGWDVASMSLGGSSSSQTLKDAIEYAYDNGVVLVAAAGNDGQCTDCVEYPGAYPETITVASSNDSDEQSSFSSQGPEVNIIAPGTDIYSTVPGGYDTYSGTSMATPHVAGAVGQLIAQGYSARDAEDQILSTTEDLGLSSNVQGSGLLDVAAALGLDSSDN
ncbi:MULTISPECIES: S8 family peptidase [unclassified Haladaptatus]|uniref:S8 family peptidase n=1 Tax=Haladaptatus sp. AB643 TaxID=2934174 RepID=UPI00209C0B00|nr:MULTISPECIES: S8 family peptidase [unclassified Haladaptatus]MCO8244145.1 S8 family peptidase [Haladaptatus sp. AB643]MCO8255950.1 S8 family peptidase [Haladaptatus sp. AB618]